jgi:hypothetical protein
MSFFEKLDAIVTEEELNSFLKDFAYQNIKRKRVLELLGEEFKKVEKEFKKVLEIRVSPKIFGEMRKLCREDFQINTDAKLLEQGEMGCIWGAKIIIPAGCRDEEHLEAIGD